MEIPGPLQQAPQVSINFAVIFECRFKTFDGPYTTYHLIHKHSVFVVKVYFVDHFVDFASVDMCFVEVEHYLHRKEFHTFVCVVNKIDNRQISAIKLYGTAFRLTENFHLFILKTRARKKYTKVVKYFFSQPPTKMTGHNS